MILQLQSLILCYTKLSQLCCRAAMYFLVLFARWYVERKPVEHCKPFREGTEANCYSNQRGPKMKITTISHCTKQKNPLGIIHIGILKIFNWHFSCYLKIGFICSERNGRINTRIFPPQWHMRITLSSSTFSTFFCLSYSACSLATLAKYVNKRNLQGKKQSLL